MKIVISILLMTMTVLTANAGDVRSYACYQQKGTSLQDPYMLWLPEVSEQQAKDIALELAANPLLGLTDFANIDSANLYMLVLSVSAENTQDPRAVDTAVVDQVREILSKYALTESAYFLECNKEKTAQPRAGGSN